MTNKINVTLIKSMVGRPEKHRRILRGMGLHKMHQTVLLESNPSIKGMIKRVTHLVKTEECEYEAK